MFESFDSFEDAGFDLVEHSPNKVLSGSTKAMPGYMFKKYDDDKPGKKQLRNYLRRIEGARLLRQFIADRGYSRVVTPKKWLYELPSTFPARYLVIAEKLDLISRDATERAYDKIDKTQLAELATVLYYFRGLNSTAANLPYTEDGRIAFIDTERWHHDKDYLRKVGDRLPRDRYKQAEKIYEELRKSGATPYESSI